MLVAIVKPGSKREPKEVLVFVLIRYGVLIIILVQTGGTLNKASVFTLQARTLK